MQRSWEGCNSLVLPGACRELVAKQLSLVSYCAYPEGRGTHLRMISRTIKVTMLFIKQSKNGDFGLDDHSKPLKTVFSAKGAFD